MTVSVTSTEAHEGHGHLRLLGPDARQHRRRLRRHRHLAALCVPRGRDACGAQGEPVTRDIVLGVLSLILWALFIVVTAKYVLLLLRADNNGEGGTLSLMALGQRALGPAQLAAAGARRHRRLDVHRRFHDHAGDLGAVGGRRPQARRRRRSSITCVPLTIVILVVLFAVQRSGTARVASAFGPVMVVWFATLAVIGPDAHQRRSRGAGGDQSLVRDQVPAVARHDRPGDARRGVSGGDRRRGALRRSRPFRPQADPDRLVRSSCCRRC